MATTLNIDIPYFTMHNRRKRNCLEMKVYVERRFLNVKFEIKDCIINISSDIVNMNVADDIEESQKYKVQIFLPFSVNLVTNPTVMVHDESMSYYKMMLKYPDNTDPKVFHNVDSISNLLAWKDSHLLEESYLLNDPTKNNNSLEDNLVQTLERLDITSTIVEKDVNEMPSGIYGFARMYKNLLSEFEGNWKLGIELSDPEGVLPIDRYYLRSEQERQDFDVDHYVADYFIMEKKDDHYLNLIRCLKFKPYWHLIDRADEIILTSKEMKILAGLPKKKYNLTFSQTMEVLNSLLDIILAYAYDYRITRGKHNAMSSWNITKLSATLSWFAIHKNIKECISASYRRTLCYPLIRSWWLNKCIFYDALEIFNLGKRQVLTCLLSIYEILDQDDDRCILNELYLEDYLIWIQQVHPDTLHEYAKLIKSSVKIQKKDVFECLSSIEYEAEKILKSEVGPSYTVFLSNQNELKMKLNKRRINVRRPSTSSEDNEDDSSDLSITSDDSSENTTTTFSSSEEE